MTKTFSTTKSMPQMQLSMMGDTRSSGVFSDAIAEMSDKDLIALEEDLDIYARTSLVGIQMSKLLAKLRVATADDADAENIHALPQTIAPARVSVAA